MPVVSDLVYQVSSSTGTSDFTLATVTGKNSFATAFNTGVTTNVFYYFISNRSADEWEVGSGHMSDSTTLVRDTVLKSSNSNSAVSFTSGTKDVTSDIPASLQVRGPSTSPTDAHAVVFDGTSGSLVKSAGFGFPLAVANGGTGATTNTNARTNLGLGTLATQDANNVNITGGSISGLSSGLAVASGGTGRTTLTANNVILGNGTTAVNFVAPSTSGNVLTSNGTTWTSATPASVVNGTSIVRATAITTTSGTAVNFTSIPAWVKRITVMINGVSTNGAAVVICRVGNGTAQTSGYVAACALTANANATLTAQTTGFFYVSQNNTASDIRYGSFTLTNITGNTWIQSGSVGTIFSTAQNGSQVFGKVDLSGILNVLQITTSNGTDSFDAGSVNIMYEG